MAEGSTSCRPTLVFQPGPLRKQRRRESAFVAKYEITLDECLAWTKAKSRPLCYKLYFPVKKRNTSAPSPPPPPLGCSAWVSSLLSGALQCNQHKEEKPEWIPKASCSVWLFYLFVFSPLSWVSTVSSGFHCLQPHSFSMRFLSVSVMFSQHYKVIKCLLWSQNNTFIMTFLGQKKVINDCVTYSK